MDKLLVNTRRPDITIYRNGHILIASRVARALNIHPETYKSKQIA